MDALSIGAGGMVSAMARFDASAAHTASGSGDLVQQVASRIEAKTDFQASVAVVKSADKMVGSLLDILA